jgi:solute:Na+ symporter, SSS family
MVYMALFGTGKIVFGDTLTGFVYLVVGALAGWVIYWDLNRRGWETVLE